MKKRILAIMLSAMLAATMCTACGSKSSEDSSSESEDSSSTPQMPDITGLDAAKYVNLAEYKGLTLESSTTEVTDENIDSELSYELSMMPMEVDDENAKVTEGDTVNIDYVGKINGKEFDGGSAEDTDLRIGSGQFIDGFEDGLVGAVKGQTVELNLTFPDDYSDEEYAGKDVTFTVTINAIKRPLDEITDEWVQENSDYETVDEYRESVREDLEEYNENQASSNLTSSALLQVVDASEVTDYPDDLVKYGEDVYTNQIMSYADSADESFDEYLEDQDMTEDEFKEQRKEYAQNVSKQILVVKAIADAEGFSTEDDDYQTALEKYETEYSMTEDELYEKYGESNVYFNIMADRVAEVVVNNATVTESSSEDSADTTSTDSTDAASTDGTDATSTDAASTDGTDTSDASANTDSTATSEASQGE